MDGICGEILYMEEEFQNAQMCLCTSFKEVLMYFEMNMMCFETVDIICI